MANGFNTEVLRRSVGRNPRTLLEFADLPQVQPGPSQGAIIADIAGQTIKGIGQQILQSKKLDLDAQSKAAQIGVAQQTLTLNQDKFDFDKEQAEIKSAEDSILEAPYDIASSLIEGTSTVPSMFPDTEAGNRARDMMKIRREHIKPDIDWMKAYGERTQGMGLMDVLNMEEDIIDPQSGEVLATISGAQMLDRYAATTVDDKGFNFTKSTALLSQYKNYSEHRNFYKLVADEELAKKAFGLSEGDYDRLKAADPAEADNMLTTMLMTSNPRANPNYIKNMKERVATVQRVITANNQTISSMVSETKESKTHPARREQLSGKWDPVEKKWEKKGLIQILRDENEKLKSDIMDSPQYQLSPDYKEKDTTVTSSGSLVIGGKTFKVNYNAAGEEVGKRIEIENIILPKFKGTVDDTTGAVIDTAGAVVDTTGGVVDSTGLVAPVDTAGVKGAIVKPLVDFRDIQSVLDGRERRLLLTEMSKIWRKEGSVRDDSGKMSININHPEIIKFLEGMDYFKRLAGPQSLMDTDSIPSSTLSPPPINISN